jgi:L-2-hydroxyglutarate oxidase LhgO|tara:strand:- start:845 stop:1921 length:1077 start_codon:yes stop_codon:yes gene_type:complete
MTKILIIGAGIVGLSIAYELSRKKKNFKIFVLEKNKKIGFGNSRKNSEVIHSGIYYKKNSLKNVLCIQGKKLIYDFCKRYKIKYSRTEKFFLACSKKEEKYLNKLRENSLKNGVKDVKIIDKKKLKIMEPNLIGRKALLSKSSGIFDTVGFMKKLFQITKKNKVKFIFNIKKIKFFVNKKNFKTNIFRDKIFDYVINCAGVEAIKIANKTFPDSKFPRNYLVRGVYFKTMQKFKLRRIIYRAMVPGVIRERIDTTPLLDGGYIFGPSVEKSKTTNKKKLKYKFINGIKNYLPEIDINKISYFKEGYRPKIIFKKNGINEDFYIKKMKNYNWINLFGIESPGLTSALSIAKYVKKICNL